MCAHRKIPLKKKKKQKQKQKQKIITFAPPHIPFAGILQRSTPPPRPFTWFHLFLASDLKPVRYIFFIVFLPYPLSFNTPQFFWSFPISNFFVCETSV